MTALDVPFDVERLRHYLSQHVGAIADPLELRKLEGGQSNPTYRLRAGSQTFVLRSKPFGQILSSAHAVDREYRVVTALAGSDVPVARTVCLCDDTSIIGAQFYVMEFVEGRVLWDPSLPDLDAVRRRQMFGELNRVIAALHQVDYRAVGLETFGKAESFFKRQVGRWSKQYRDSETGRIEAMERLIAWLPAHTPAGDETSIVHGDYRLDNAIFHKDEPRIVAVLDWELSTLGHPLSDFAYHCMTWRLPPGPLRGLAGVDLVAAGIPTEAEYVQMYCEQTGRASIDPATWTFCLAFNLFRLAAILQGIARRAADGTSNNANAGSMGLLAGAVAELGWRQVESAAA